MKRFLCFMVMSLVAIIPFSVSAASEITYNCGEVNSSGSRTCTVGYIIDATTPQNSVSVTLTEKGGANITSIDGVASSEFSVSTKNETNGVHSVVLASPDAVAGQFDLFTFTYTTSGTEDCKVTVGIGNENKDVTPAPTPDTPSDDVQTGSTLPYIALGFIGIVAVSAYLATKNKSKMYKI